MRMHNLELNARDSVRAGNLREAVFCYDSIARHLETLANEFGYELKPKGI